ncbi:MAG TPA: glucan biosynthesis protein G [Gammaproteobacteria bacterium]|nr:glucan biosynthesis protein G [Gammaproteobacteria bacterium]
MTTQVLPRTLHGFCIRLLRAASLGCLLLVPQLSLGADFGFENVTAIAQKLAAQPYQPPQQVPQWLRDLSYDQWRDIRFKPAESLWRKEKLPFEVQFFHTGLYYDRGVTIHVVNNGQVAPLAFSTDFFDYGKNTIPEPIPANIGFAGLRIHAPIKTDQYYDEVAVFLGASYFRAIGAPNVYGLSARGLAVDTAAPNGEEFPWFREFWLVKPVASASQLTLYALLDSPSVAGAYKFVITPGEETVLDVDSVVFPRKPIGKLGIAPLTSMFFYGENVSQRPVNDFRPEVHDSDGLLITMEDGERLWRPLTNPKRLAVNSFIAANPRGFGLMQRDTDFDHYLDLEARYDLRPSTWITPKGAWGEGSVELIQIPSPNELHDNIVAFWVPKAKVEPGKPLAYAYRMNWYKADPQRVPAGHVVATRVDNHHASKGENDHIRRFMVEFDGNVLRTLPADAAVEAVVDVGEGARLLETQVMKNSVTDGWRLVFQITGSKAGPIKRVLEANDAQPVELRAFLRNGDDTLTETWSYALQP